MSQRRRAGKVGVGFILSVLLNLALAGGLGYLLYSSKLAIPGLPANSGTEESRKATGGSSTELTTGGVNAIGRIQPASGLISVYGPVGDYVKSYQVKLGDSVREGQILGELSGDADRAMQLEALKSQIVEAEALKLAIEASAKAKLADVDAEAKLASVGVEQDTRSLDAKMKAVSAQKARAVAELKRLTDAKAAGVPVSAQEFEQIDVLKVQADAENEAAEAQKKKIVVVKEQGEVSIAAKKATVDAETKRALALVPLASLRASLKLAENKIKTAELRAPTAGRIVRIMTKASDTITTQPILQIAEPTRMTVTAEVYETDIGKVRDWLKNGAVQATIDAQVIGKDVKFAGTVSGASKVATVISKNVLTPLGPREDTDRRVVDVEVDLDAESSRIASNYIGLQVRVTLQGK